jgi:hypothetical protein
LEALEDRQLFSTLTVTSLQDSGAGSLRAQIAAAQSGDTIVFSSSLFTTTTAISSPLLSSSVKLNGSAKQGHGKPTKSPPPPPNTIVLTSGQLTLTKNLTIQGPSTTQLTISGTTTNSASRIFEVSQNTTVTLSRMTVSRGFSGYGGGIFNQGALALNGCTISGNFVHYNGGGIYNVGTLSINNSTLSGNSARFGGAIYNAGGMVTIDSSTLSGNIAFHSDYPWAGGDGGGIYNDANGTVTVRNFSSITGNTSEWYEGLGPDVYNLGTIYHDGTSTIGFLVGNSAILI